MLSTADEADLIAWILREATARNDPEALVAGVCDRLAAAGSALLRMSVAVPTIDPVIRGASLTWRRGQSLVFLATAHTESEAIFQRSPIFALIAQGITFGRWPLGPQDDVGAYPLLGELRAEGGTDYVLFLVPFPNDTALVGTGLSFTSDRPGGFAADELAQIERLVPALGLAICRINLWRSASEALTTYLGPMTGHRVLAGHVRRGEGETIAAAILLADLSGFTSLADQHDPEPVVGWLNQHLGAIGEPILAAGGEILKFMGDGLLAVFPVEDVATLPCPACGRALAAAEQAAIANAALNAERHAEGAPELRADIALHFGDVVYGNVGTMRRLDFTTIGRAVNEASRIEKLCTAERSLILSDTFAARCGDRNRIALGAFELRGLAEPRTLWGLG